MLGEREQRDVRTAQGKLRATEAPTREETPRNPWFPTGRNHKAAQDDERANRTNGEKPNLSEQPRENQDG